MENTAHFTDEQPEPTSKLTEWERDLLSANVDRTPPRYTTVDENAAADDEHLNRVEDQEADAFDRTTHAVAAVEHAETTGATVETLTDAEFLYAAQLVTEADATDGTWRGEWIGDHPTT